MPEPDHDVPPTPSPELDASTRPEVPGTREGGGDGRTRPTDTGGGWR